MRTPSRRGRRCASSPRWSHRPPGRPCRPGGRRRARPARARRLRVMARRLKAPTASTSRRRRHTGPPGLDDAGDAARVRRHAGWLAAVAGGRMASRRRVPVRAAGGLLGGRRHRADHAPEGVARPLPGGLAGRAGLDPRRPARAPGGALPGAPRRELDPARSLRCCATTASKCGRASRSWCARRRWPGRCCWRSSARCSSARHGRCCGWRCPGQEDAFWAAARDGSSTPSRRRAGEAERTDASLRIPAPENTRALAGVDPARLARAARAGRRCATPRWPGDGARRCGRRRRAPARGHVHRDFAAFVGGRCSSTATTRSPPGPIAPSRRV